jgi:hypothetical protein
MVSPIVKVQLEILVFYTPSEMVFPSLCTRFH